MGVDPGETCGVARLRELPNGWHAFDSYALTSDDAIDLVRVWLHGGPTPTHGTVVVCERYTIGQRTVKMSRQPRALEVIGAVRRACREEGTLFELQGVSDAKRLGNQDVLKRIGWWRVGPDADHANDAAAHVLLATARHFPTVFRQLVTLVK